MELRIEKTSAALGSFLEEELAQPSLGLPEAAAKHLERFRSFLHSFYVQRHGYWPPVNLQPSRHGDRPNALPKHLLLTMYADFRNLYEFIADPTDAAAADAPAGGSDALAAVRAFDKTHRFAPLPHQLPRLPAGPWLARPPSSGSSTKSSGFAASARTLFAARRGRPPKVDRAAAAQAYAHASNARDTKVARARIVREFALFEREAALHDAGADRADPAAARTARWVLVYAALQLLASVTRAPAEVRDTQGVEYPLCCQTAGTPPWTFVRPAPKEAGTGYASASTLSLPLKAGASAGAAAASSDEDAATTVSPASTPDSATVAPLDLHRVSHQRTRNSFIAAPAVVPARAVSVPPPAAPAAPAADAAPAPAPGTFAALIADIQRGPHQRDPSPALRPAPAPSTTRPALPHTASASAASPPLSPPPRTRNFSRLTPSPAGTPPAASSTPPSRPALPREPSLARALATAAGSPMRCPVPTKPACARVTDALLRNLDPLTTTAAHTPFPVRAAPTAPAPAADDAARASTAARPRCPPPAATAAAAPPSPTPRPPGAAAGAPAAAAVGRSRSRGPRDAPSPSIYPEDDLVGGGARGDTPEVPELPPTPTTPGGGPAAAAKHKRDRSSELARRWREEIRWREGPGWSGDVEEMLMGGE